MNTLSLYGLAFLISCVKFLFAASIMSTSALSPFEIALSTGIGALVSFNFFYLTAGYFMQRTKDKKAKAIAEGTYVRKNAFTNMNKFMVKLKGSKSGFWIACIFAPLILSIPVGSIIVAKFYRETKLAYPVAMIAIAVWAFVLAYLNDVIFGLF
ncbi:MAG TPA: hypothetical protein PKD85_21325 [Saprospiraceae bacterium]|mgnify:CR=1 FL=1|nr:hypothetical protein [Saprospiraceae bacterium]